MGTGRLIGRSFWGFVCSEGRFGRGTDGMAARAKRRSMALGDTGDFWVEVEHKEGRAPMFC